MKAEELRIGNYVKCVEGNTICVDKDDMIYILSNTFEVEPITLSEEVLLKCGCNISPITIGLRYKHLYRLVWDDEFKYWDILQGEYGCFITRIQYLHEWQNFIHIINGEELEVSL